MPFFRLGPRWCSEHLSQKADCYLSLLEEHAHVLTSGPWFKILYDISFLYSLVSFFMFVKYKKTVKSNKWLNVYKDCSFYWNVFMMICTSKHRVVWILLDAAAIKYLIHAVVLWFWTYCWGSLVIWSLNPEKVAMIKIFRHCLLSQNNVEILKYNRSFPALSIEWNHFCVFGYL